MNAPILWDHDHQRPPMGFVTSVNGALRVQFGRDVRVNRAEFEAIFGNVGYLVLEVIDEPDGPFIATAEIKEWSMSLFTLKLDGPHHTHGAPTSEVGA